MTTSETDRDGGLALARAPCLACGLPFTFNPHRVPFYDAGRGKRPICRSCMERINEKRRAWGETPPSIPKGAYEILQGEL